MKRLIVLGGIAAAAVILLFASNPISPIIKRANQPELPTPSPAQTPTSTPKPTPTPTFSGFCFRLPILLYHHIKPADLAKEAGQSAITVYPDFFESQLAYLNSKEYHTVRLEEVGRMLKDHQKPAGKTLAITIDDGYDDIYYYVFPLIKKHNITINLFIPTGLINNSGYLTWDQLREMKGSGLVFAYNHSWSHPKLGSLTKEKIQFEINTAQKQLEESLGQSQKIFAYPYGSENSKTIDFLRTSGFLAAVSTIPGTVQCDSFIFNLHRTRIGNALLSAYGI